jgi:hypothetical protein
MQGEGDRIELILARPAFVALAAASTDACQRRACRAVRQQPRYEALAWGKWLKIGCWGSQAWCSCCLWGWTQELPTDLQFLGAVWAAFEMQGERVAALAA